MTGGSYAYRKYLRRINKCCGIRPEFGEKEADSINDHKWKDLFLKVWNEGHCAKGNRHHQEPEHLNCFTSKLVHGERSNSIARRRKDHKNDQLCHRLMQQRVMCSKK